MGVRTELDGPPEEFAAAVAALRAAALRPEVAVEPIPAPQRIAPYATALSADVRDGADDLGSGRLVLLYDPAGNEAWEGTFRCVAFGKAEVGVEMVADPLVSAVSWSWLTDALAGAGAAYVALSGTVTSVLSEGFGGMADDGSTAQLEIRASWTPLDGVTAHVRAWAEMLCTVSGLPPLPPGVSSLSPRGQPRG
jgi:hypothetical protein